jgi:hypothetical protein
VDRGRQGQHHPLAARSAAQPRGGRKKNETPLKDAFEALLEGCAPSRRLRSHLTAALLSPDRATLSNLICLGGRADADWTAEYRLYSRGRADAGALLDKALEEVCAALPAQLPLVIGVDDTTVRKTGMRIPGVAWRRDPLGPAFQTNLVTAQRFLMFSAAWPLEQGDARMLPVRFDHAPTARRPASGAAPEELAAWRKEKRRTSLGARTVEGMEALAARCPGRKLVFCGDGGFTNGPVVKHLPAGCAFIGRVRQDAKLHFAPKPPACGEVGRRRIYGERAPTPGELLANDSVPWREIEGFAAGRRHRFRVKEVGGLLWRPAGGAARLRLLVIAPLGYRLRKGSKLLYRRPAFLICTDPDLKTEELLQCYLWRWGVEVNFRDVKQLVGVGDAQVRSELSNKTLPAALVGGYSLLWAAALKLLASGTDPAGALVAPKWRRRIEGERKTPSTGQLLRELRTECWRRSLLPEGCRGFSAHPAVDAKPQKLTFPLSGLFQTA